MTDEAAALLLTLLCAFCFVMGMVLNWTGVIPWYGVPAATTAPLMVIIVVDIVIAIRRAVARSR